MCTQWKSSLLPERGPLEVKEVAFLYCELVHSLTVGEKGPQLFSCSQRDKRRLSVLSLENLCLLFGYRSLGSADCSPDLHCSCSCCFTPVCACQLPGSRVPDSGHCVHTHTRHGAANTRGFQIALRAPVGPVDWPPLRAPLRLRCCRVQLGMCVGVAIYAQ